MEHSIVFDCFADEVESKLPQSIDLSASKDSIYEDFKNTFTLSRNDYPGVAMTFIPHIHTQLDGSSKQQKVEWWHMRCYSEEKVEWNDIRYELTQGLLCSIHPQPQVTHEILPESIV